MEITNKEFLLSDVCAILNIKLKTLSMWLDRKQVFVSNPATGQGSRNIFTFEDLLRIRLFQILAEAGLTLSNASKIAFASEKDPVIKKLFFIAKDRILNPRNEGRQISMFDQRSKRIYFAFYQKQNDIHAELLKNNDEFANLYKRGGDFFYIVRIDSIVRYVVDMIEKKRG